MEYTFKAKYKIGDAVFAIVESHAFGNGKPTVKPGTIRAIVWNLDELGGATVSYYINGKISEAGYAGARTYNEQELMSEDDALARFKELVKTLKPFDDFFHQDMVAQAKAFLAKEDK